MLYRFRTDQLVFRDDEEGVVDVIVEMAQRLDAARCPPFQLGLQL